jgi:hypothetical protein
MRLFERFSSVVAFVRPQGAGPAIGQAHIPLLALMPSRSPNGADVAGRSLMGRGDEA